MNVLRFSLISLAALMLIACALIFTRFWTHDESNVVSVAVASAALSTNDGPYMYHGCTVYTPNDWFTTNLITGGSRYVPNTVDPNSANIIANLSQAFPGLYVNVGHPGSETTVNLATNSTPKHFVNGATMIGRGEADHQVATIPVTSPFYEEGTAGCSDDCHAIVLNTQTCLDYETYRFGKRQWDGNTYNTGYASVYDLKHSLDSQYENHVGVTAASLPLLGMTDFGEDATAALIPHIVEFSLPGSGAHPNASGGRVAPAATAHDCETNCTYKLPLGARLRLKSSYQCPARGGSPQAYLVCNQLKSYGMIFVDWNGSYGAGTSIIELRFGTTTDGINPWNRDDLFYGLKDIKIEDFDVMTLGKIR